MLSLNGLLYRKLHGLVAGHVVPQGCWNLDWRGGSPVGPDCIVEATREFPVHPCVIHPLLEDFLVSVIAFGKRNNVFPVKFDSGVSKVLDDRVEGFFSSK